jgi:AcrR family transcriptional regulator
MARPLGLNTDEVLAAAESVADAHGLEGLTVARVASALGVRPPSLYYHVGGLPGLRRALALRGAERLDEGVRAAAAGLAGAAALAAICHAYRRAALASPGAYQATIAALGPADVELAAALAAPLAPVRAALGSMGVAPARQLDCIRRMRAALHGWVDLERRAGLGNPEQLDAAFETLVGQITDDAARAGGT